MGNCLAGESCIFSHNPAHLINGLNIQDGGAMVGTPPVQVHPSFQVQDYDFPSLQGGSTFQMGQSPSSPTAINSYFSGVPNSNGYFPSIRRSFDARNNQNNGMSSSPASHGSRSNSRHQSRPPTPSIPPVDDNEAFPTLGAAGAKGKKHHGKRGGHGHSHGAKENMPNYLADVVKMSPSPVPSKPRQGLMKKGSYQNTRENSLAAQAIPAPQHVPWLETGQKTNQAYLRIRQEAFKHGGLRNKFLQRYVYLPKSNIIPGQQWLTPDSAAQAWNRNDARAAKALSLRGQSENDLMRKAHREAARLLYEERNKDGSSGAEIYVDLHGLHPEEAVDYLERVLTEQQKSSRPVYAITGTGHHSKNGKDKVGKAVRNWLNEWRYAWREFSVQGDNIGTGGLLGIDPKSFDKSVGEERKVEVAAKEEEIMGGKIRVVKEMPRAKVG